MDIDEIEVRRLDLTVLLVFVHLVRLRKASQVAAHMGLTQSSISHSIKRLRDSFGDPLFLRTPKGMEPTAVALGLEPKIRHVVETLSSALKDPVAFDPASSTGILRLGAYDSEMTSLVPPFLRKVRNEAPGMRVSILPLARQAALEALDHGTLDLALGLAWNLPRNIRRIGLYQENYSVVLRQGHPIARQGMSLDRYLEAEHLIVSPRGDLTGIVDEHLKSQGLSRSVVMAVPQFLPALALVADTDMIATVPRRLAASQKDRYQLIACPPPLEIRSFTVSALLHERNANNPMHAWLIDHLTDVVAQSVL
ncbi:MAG: LysR family transcriptional regulator [Pseudomonadota bacterium]